MSNDYIDDVVVSSPFFFYLFRLSVIFFFLFSHHFILCYFIILILSKFVKQIETPKIPKTKKDRKYFREIYRLFVLVANVAVAIAIDIISYDRLLIG